MKNCTLLPLAALSVAALTLPLRVTAQAPTYYERGTVMTPRFQWNANSGYCGETAFISAGMRFGQYTSQWTARSLASPGIDQTNASSQLLLGENDLLAAGAMRLRATPFDSGNQKTVRQFLQWVKERFLDGDVVIIGVLNNTKILNEWPEDKGDAYYDHIVPVFGIGSGLPLSDLRYDKSDLITISDNGLRTVGDNVPYLFTYSFASFPRTRAGANAIGGPVYALRHRPENFGTAVKGVIDPDGVTIPVLLTSDVDSEGVQNGEGPDQLMVAPPPGMPITLTAHVTIPDTNKAYRLYLYDGFTNVPTNNFNASAAHAMTNWIIPAGGGSTWSVTITNLSSDTRVFRAVPTEAP